MQHICVVEWFSTGSDNGLSPIRRQAIIGSSAGLLSIATATLGTNLGEVYVVCENAAILCSGDEFNDVMCYTAMVSF